MKTKDVVQQIERAAFDGYVQGLIEARYYALRYSKDDAFYAAPVPSETPEVVEEILDSICNDCRNRHLFQDGWDSLDELLLCDSREQVEAKFETEEQDTHH